MNWKNIINAESEKQYYKELVLKLDKERKSYNIYPPEKDMFNAFNYTVYENVKAVILGMDPYHGENQANGLCFSVNENIKIPPSLRNIFKELKSDLDIDTPKHGSLVSWAQQGVFLLNSMLTVREGQPGSHKDLNWQIFTDKIISILNEKEVPIVFILWGAFARKKSALISNKRHLILESVHPSPLSAHSGFFGSKPFSKTNEFLKKNNLKEIDWQIK